MLAAGALLVGALAGVPLRAGEPPSGPTPVERAEHRLGAVTAFADGRHVIALLPRARPGTATAAGEALATRHGAALEAVWTLASVEETCLVLRVADGADARAVSERVRAEEGVVVAYPVQAFRTRDVEVDVRLASLPSALSAEPLERVQDALRTMRVDAASEVVSGAGARVALIDSAVAVDHPDLADQDVEFEDFVGREVSSGESHGTALAALIAADAANGVGMAGVAPEASLLALRACWQDEAGRGSCNTFSLAVALDRAVLADADVINMGLEGPPDDALVTLVRTAQEFGAVVIAAQGGIDFPAGLPGVLSVSPSDGPRAGDDPLGDVRAPGFEVLSAAPSGGYDFYTGSSIASAHASGVAALVRSGSPEADALAVGRAIEAGAADGPLDACAALAALPDGPRCP